ncbi:MAG TPA: hypothetical protein VIL86_18295 [Tepidisphaeraceae bacterium]|jgi:hypothetical protein
MKTKAQFVPKKRRGFAALTAIALLGLIAVALAAGGVMFAADARRTMAAQIDAQLRQGLIAGGDAVQARTAKWKENAAAEKFDLVLPPNLASLDAAVSVEIIAKPAMVEAHVTAKIGRRNSAQTLQLERKGGKWELTAVIQP